MTMIEGLDVSRETFEKLTAYAALVEKWTARINLISHSSIPHIWERHILDSIQLIGLRPSFVNWVDIGSGGGFPGIVIAIMAREDRSQSRKVTLVESDSRKCAFLRTAVRELDLDAIVLNERIEALEGLGADVLSARALGDLSRLLGFAERHLAPDGTALFLKGENWQAEHEVAKTQWSYRSEAIRSKTNPAAAVLKIKDIARV